MSNSIHIASQFGQLADDFFFSIALLKATEPTCMALPFLQAHTLELSAKGAYHKLELPLADIKNGHDVLAIYNLLSGHVPGLGLAIK